jgi:hypothetical protein
LRAIGIDQLWQWRFTGAGLLVGYTYQKLGPAADIPIYRGMLQLWGRHGGYSREPFSALTKQQLEQLSEELRATGWLD